MRLGESVDERMGSSRFRQIEQDAVVVRVRPQEGRRV